MAKQESPPAWTQEAYRPPCSEYSFCCPTWVPPPQGGTPTPPGGYPVRYPPQGVPGPPPGGVPSQVPPQGVPGGYPDPPGGVPGQVPPRGVPGTPGGVPGGYPDPRGVPGQVPPPGRWWGRVGGWGGVGGVGGGGGGGVPGPTPRGGTQSGTPRGGTWTPRTPRGVPGPPRGVPGQVPPRGGGTRTPPLPHGILGNVAKHYGIWVPPPGVDRQTKWNYYLPVVLRTRAVKKRKTFRDTLMKCCHPQFTLWLSTWSTSGKYTFKIFHLFSCEIGLKVR